MPTTRSCPRCQRAVEIDDEAADAWLTCRHCLGSLRNPRNEEATTTAPAPASVSCDVCGEALQPAWRFCPQCNTPRKRSAGSPLDTGLERDVRRDNAASGWVAVGLCVTVAVAAIGVALTYGGGDLIRLSPEGNTIAVLVLLAVLLVVGLVTAQAVTGREKAAKAISGVLGGIAIAAIVAFGFLLVLCAGIVHFISTCGGLLR
jgi:hypothetical protein